MQKLYCYVDESGQDTRGAFFVVAVVVTQADREQLLRILALIEAETKKGTRKWSKSRPERRYAYIRRILQEPLLRRKLSYSLPGTGTHYVETTIEATARAIASRAGKPYKASVFVDGLSRPDEKRFARGLRTHRIRIEKVRGVRDEEANALMRLADAVCGLVREAIYDGNPELSGLLARALKDGFITDETV